jgi:UDP-N-acetylmuramoyl-L-alanyl-D-glutamate--2,6-diaminopimelate ligase
MTFNELLNLVSSGKSPNVCVDSRLVKAGDIFVAIEGTIYDGHNFIDQAIANGAKYIVCESRKSSHESQTMSHKIVVVNDSARAAAILVQASRGNPASKLTNLAVTGTNGKTTVAFLVRSCIQKAGAKCGLIGTILYDTCSGQSSESTLTTPDSLSIAEMTDKMVKNGAKYMVIEASSHALSQNRLAGINFKAAAFTNLTGDHLDYHKTKEEYLAAKTKLFLSLSHDATAVLNKQSPEAELIAEKIRHRKTKILWYAIDEPAAPTASCEARAGADITAHIESMNINETVFTLEYTAQSSIVHRPSSLVSRPPSLVSRPSSIVKSPLLGRHNVSNSLAAAGLCIAAGFDLETIAAGLSAPETVPGRLERVDWEGDFSVIVDYAHTDDALKNVLSTLKPLCKGKLRVVFGCGGDRDRTKRSRMARVAEELADFVVVTSDNPRTEKPEAIIEEIIAGFEKSPAVQHCEIRNTQYAPRTTKIIEPDRRKAIELAIKTAEKDDIVLIAGKGHETYQIIGTKKFDFSDKTVAEQCLKKLSRT